MTARGALVVFLAALELAAAEPVPPLSLRSDARNPTSILVRFSPDGQQLPIDVVWYPPPGGEQPASYRSPELDRFDVCAFVRAVKAASTKGPLDVVVRRGDQEVRVNLTYDGRTCELPYPTPASSPPKRRRQPLPTPAPMAPIPVVVIGPVIEFWRPSEAGLDEAVLRLDGPWVVFEVRYDRPLRISSRSSVIVSDFLRPDQGGRHLKGRPAFPLSLKDSKTLRWKVSTVLAGFDPPLKVGEIVKVTFELDRAEFVSVPFRVRAG